MATSYERIKPLNLFMTSLVVPFGTLTGYWFGTGNYSLAIVAMTVQTAFVFLQAACWWRTAELIGFRTTR